MQKRAEQNTNIKEGNYYSLLEFHALGDHQNRICSIGWWLCSTKSEQESYRELCFGFLGSGREVKKL